MSISPIQLITIIISNDTIMSVYRMHRVLFEISTDVSNMRYDNIGVGKLSFTNFLDCGK